MKRIRLSLIVLLCMIFAACFAFSAGAAEILYSGTCGADGDNLTWTLTDDGVLEINGTGNMKNYRSSSSPWYSYRDIIINVVISDSITSIGRYAFENCTNIEKVYITSIEAWMRIAFFHSYSNPLYYNADLYLNEKRITELVIPDTVTSICDYAFSGYNSLTSVTIPNSVTSIGYFAFNGCTSIEKVYISSIEGWMNISFESYSNPLNNGANLYFNDKKLTELVIPDSITTVNSYAFSGCNSLTSVTIPDNVTIINVGAFSNCTNLTNVTIHDTITTINDGAFYGCNSIEKVYINSIEAWVNIDFHGASSNPLFGGADLYINGEKLTELVIPNTATIIDSTFSGCNSLTSVIIPNSVTYIGSDSFRNCSKLKKITIGNSVTSIGSYAFYNCENLMSIIIPDKVTTIDSYAFANCKSLESVYFSNSITYIGDFAFYGCTNIEKVYIASVESWASIDFQHPYSTPLYYNADLYLDGNKLTELVIPSSITSIGNYTFRGCTSLISVTIPDGVTDIESYTFASCNHLTSISIPNSVTYIGDFAFYGCTNIEKIHIANTENWMNISFKNKHSSPSYYGADLYLNGEKLINLTIPSTQTDIKDYSFYGCKSLKTITVPESVTTIPESAFKDCTNATIYGYANTCAETTARANILPFVALDEGWQPKLMYNGKCGDNLMWQLYQDGRLTLGFMNDVTSDAIYDYTTSSSPTWNTYATLVRTVDFPKGITRVGDYAFNKLTGIVTVNYSGNEESWKEIEIGSNNVPFEKAYILYGESVNVNISYKDVLKTTATVNGKVIPVIINLEAGTTWKELKANLIYSDYTDVIVYNHDGKLIELDDALSTGFVLHHINKDGAIIEELLISVSGDVTGDSIVNAEDLQNVVAHLAGEDNNLNKIAIDKNLDDILTMQELNSFISTFR